MATHIDPSLACLIGAGDCISVHEESGIHTIDVVFYRVIDAQSKEEVLCHTTKREMHFFDKILFFFRIGKFSPYTINKLMQRTLGKDLSLLRDDQKYYLGRSVAFWGEKIRKGNTSKIKRFFHVKKNEDPITDFIVKQLRQIKVPIQKENQSRETESVTQVNSKRIQENASYGRGIKNPGFLCYFNASIKAIWCSPGLRASIEEFSEEELAEITEALDRVSAQINIGVFNGLDIQLIKKYCSSFRDIPTIANLSPARVYVENCKNVRIPLCKVLAELDQKGEILTHDSSPMKELIEALYPIFPDLAETWDQQDLQELFIKVLEAILPLQQQAPICLQQTVERERSSREDAQKETGDKKVQKLIGAAYIPVLDSSAPETTSMYIYHPTEQDNQRLTDIFSSYEEELVDPAFFINDEKNSWLTAQDKELLQAKETYPISIQRKRHFEGNLPDFFPIYVARFIPTYNHGEIFFEKNTHLVGAPFMLEVPGKTEEEKKRYQLHGIVCHSGESLKSGHYYNYFPVKDSPLREDGRPVYWVRHSDHIISDPLRWEDIADDVGHNATMYMYNA